MKTKEALLSNIIANPNDDLVRLVYADWLDDNGQPERAEFIRVQIQLARLVKEDGWAIRPTDPAGMLNYHKAIHENHRTIKRITQDKSRCICEYCLWQRALHLVKKYGQDWFDFSPNLFPPSKTIERGFIKEVKCTVKQWTADLGIGRWVCRDNPIEFVNLTDAIRESVVSYLDRDERVLLMEESILGPIWRHLDKLPFRRGVIYNLDQSDKMKRDISAAAINWARS